MEGHHRHETDIDGKVRHEEKEDPSHGGQDCTGTMPDTAGSDPQADTTPDTDTTRLVDQDLTDMVGSDFTMDISAADVDSEFLDLPRRLSGRSSPSMIYRLSQDGQELITGVDSCRITVPSSLPKTVHLPQTLVHHDLPDIEVSDVNIVDVDIVIDHTYDNTDVTTHAPTDCTHAGNVDRGNRRDAGLWINLEPQCHTLLSPRSSAGSISSYRSSNDSAIELLTPDDDMPGSDTQVWDSQAEGDYNKGAMWDNDTTVPNTYSVSTDSGNAITLWSELLYSDSSHQDSFNRVPFSLTADSKLRPDRDASREPTTASEYPEGPFTTGAFSTTSDCDLAGPTSFSNQQQGPHSPSIHKEGTISSIEHKQGPLQSHDYHGRSSWEPFSSRNYKKTSLSCHDFSVEPVVSSANPTFMCVAPPSVVISDFSTKVPLEDKGSQTSDSTQYTYLEQPYVKCHRSMSSSSISSNESSSTSFSVQSDSSVDVDDNLEIPLPTVKKQSSWKKIRNIVHWSPFIQQFKRRQYPWIQLAGHQGNFQAGEPGAILKKYDAIEHRCFNKLMKDVLRPYVPEYRGEVAQGGECYVQLQDLLCEFDAPCVMDVKMGRRTYLEDELVKARQKPSLRKDMYQKMVEVDPSAPTEAEHQQQGITKPRYMQWRDEMSSSIEHGFRIEGIRTSDGASIKDFKKTKHKDNIKETLKYFVGDSTTVLTKYLRRLKSVRATQEDSAFFRSHEVIGSSLLFVHDKTGQASVWMIDFGKTVPLADNLTVDHRSEWHEGNHEDGYMYGLDSLIQIFTELLAACSENVTSDSASRRENLITCSSETMMSDSTSRRENLITCNSETMMSDSSTSSRRENLVSATNSDTRVSGSSDKFVNIVSDSNVECDSKCEPNNKTTDTIGHYS